MSIVSVDWATPLIIIIIISAAAAAAYWWQTSTYIVDTSNDVTHISVTLQHKWTHNKPCRERWRSINKHNMSEATTCPPQ